MGHDFNPRSPDGERQSGLLVLGLAVDISIHAPRMGSDLDRTTAKASRLLFQSTLPGWGATVVGTKYWISAYVFQSTLPGWGATVEIRTILTQIRYFNPRSPDGERPRNPINTPLFVKFQSTLPGWGATSARSSFGSSQSVFQSTLPGWGATGTNQHVRNLKRFQSTLPGWGATWLVA